MTNANSSTDSSTISTATTTPTAANCGTNRQDLGLYFLDMARRGSSKGAPYVDDAEAEEAPSELNTINSSAGFLVVSTDKLSVKYTSVNLHGHDVGAVQANKPAPVKRLVYYFEMCVKDAGSKGQFAIGFTTESFKMRRHPGWEPNSIGYHGDDGLLYHGGAKIEPFGPTYTSGDVVGAGINYASQEFFFIKNGALVGAVYKDIKGPIFPTVAVHSPNEEIHVNFGQNPFSFDLKAFEAAERVKQQTMIDKISLPPNISYRIICSYLRHYGYEETLNSLNVAAQGTVPLPDQANGCDEADIVYGLSQRRTLRQLIRSGKIDEAFSRLQEWYPQIIQDDKSATCFLLHCQNFIELVRVGKLEEAVKYGRAELPKFFGMSKFQELVQDCVALLAYEHPKESFVGYLLEDSQREVVADMVNAVILSTNPNVKDPQGCLYSSLERLLRQLTACCLERRFMNGGQGEAFNLSRILNARFKEYSS